MGQSNSPSENYLFLNVMVNFVIVNQKLTGSALHIEKNQTIYYMYMNKALTFCNTEIILYPLSSLESDSDAHLFHIKYLIHVNGTRNYDNWLKRFSPV